MSALQPFIPLLSLPSLPCTSLLPGELVPPLEVAEKLLYEGRGHHHFLPPYQAEPETLAAVSWYLLLSYSCTARSLPPGGCELLEVCKCPLHTASP